jgi:predicted nucleic acid-binding protein
LRYLVDTNIISELVKKSPDPRVVDFLEKLDDEELFLSVVTIGEIKFGIEKVTSTTKKEELKLWLYNGLLEEFSDRIVNIDAEIMIKWGTVSYMLQSSGTPMPIMDSLIAATCLTKNFVLITRNEKDFKNLDVEIINPFKK